MPKKKAPAKQTDGLLVSAAKNIGKAAAKIVSAVNVISKPKAAAKSKPAKPAAKTAKPAKPIKPASKPAAKSAVAVKKKAIGRKTR